MNILEVEGICKHYKTFELENISFELPAGYIMGYVGENGSGKTTTLGIITSCLKADSGIVKINGKTADEDAAAYKESIGFIGDELYFPIEFTIKDIRACLKDFYPTFDEVRFDGMIEKWKLPQKKKVGDFSRGMKVQLMFASVLSRDTKIMILDEATNGLDPVIRREILGLIQEYIADGTRSVLFSTHIMDDLEQIADYIYFIHAGKKVLCQEKEALFEQYRIVKGGMEDLTADLRKRMIGVMESSMGFEALAKWEDVKNLSDSYVMEKPTVDEIVVHYILEKR